MKRLALVLLLTACGSDDKKEPEQPCQPEVQKLSAVQLDADGPIWAQAEGIAPKCPKAVKYEFMMVITSDILAPNCDTDIAAVIDPDKNTQGDVIITKPPVAGSPVYFRACVRVGLYLSPGIGITYNAR